jgi:hypothetical protein
MEHRRFSSALFLTAGLLLAGCGGGGGGGAALPPAAQVVPPVTATPVPSSSVGPVGYLQASGSTVSGNISAGSQQALVAIISGASDPQSFGTDTLTVNTASSVQTALRTAQVTRSLIPSRVNPVEAFPADDSALLRKVQRLSAGGTGAARMAVRTHGVLPASLSVGTTANVWVQKGSLGGSRTNVQVPAKILAQTAHANIWVDSSLSLTQSDLAQVQADVENAYASDTAHFASADYASNAPGLQPQYSTCAQGGASQGSGPAYIQEPADRRIDVMIVNSSNLGGLGGYFSGANLMTQATLNCLNGSGSTYESNEAPFIFVGWFSSSGTTYVLQEDLVRSTAHELQHLINFVNHAILASGASSASFNGYEDTYINEGLSMLAQDLAVQNMYGSRGVQFDVDDAMSRADVYLSAPSQYSLTAFSGIDPATWGGNDSAQYNCGGGCYGSAYLFQRYLRDRFGGDTYTHEIETSGVVGNQNLQAVTRESEASLFGDFTLAMAANTLHVSSSDPRFNFGSLNLTGRYADQFGASTTLTGVNALPYSGSGMSVSAPLGGVAFVRIGSVPAGGTPVSVTATAPTFALQGGLAQK